MCEKILNFKTNFSKKETEKLNEFEMFNMETIDLSKLINDAKVALRLKNIKYQNLLNEVANIMEKHPNLQLIYEDDQEINLTKDDCKMLQKLFNLHLDIKEFEEQTIFFLGGKEVYFYFKNIGILKE